MLSAFHTAFVLPLKFCNILHFFFNKNVIGKFPTQTHNIWNGEKSLKNIRNRATRTTTRCCTPFAHQIIINISFSWTEASFDSDNLISFMQLKNVRGRDRSFIDFTVNWNLISRNISNISANNDWTKLIGNKWNDISPQTKRYLLGFSIYSFQWWLLSLGTTQCQFMCQFESFSIEK
jgi:hypothetical protein